MARLPLLTDQNIGRPGVPLPLPDTGAAQGAQAASEAIGDLAGAVAEWAVTLNRAKRAEDMMNAENAFIAADAEIGVEAAKLSDPTQIPALYERRYTELQQGLMENVRDANTRRGIEMMAGRHKAMGHHRAVRMAHRIQNERTVAAANTTLDRVVRQAGEATPELFEGYVEEIDETLDQAVSVGAMLPEEAVAHARRFGSAALANAVAGARNRGDFDAADALLDLHGRNYLSQEEIDAQRDGVESHRFRASDESVWMLYNQGAYTGALAEVDRVASEGKIDRPERWAAEWRSRISDTIDRQQRAQTGASELYRRYKNGVFASDGLPKDSESAEKFYKRAMELDEDRLRVFETFGRWGLKLPPSAIADLNAEFGPQGDMASGVLLLRQIAQRSDHAAVNVAQSLQNGEVAKVAYFATNGLSPQDEEFGRRLSVLSDPAAQKNMEDAQAVLDARADSKSPFATVAFEKSDVLKEHLGLDGDVVVGTAAERVFGEMFKFHWVEAMSARQETEPAKVVSFAQKYAARAVGERFIALPTPGDQGQTILAPAVFGVGSQNNPDSKGVTRLLDAIQKNLPVENVWFWQETPSRVMPNLSIVVDDKVYIPKVTEGTPKQFMEWNLLTQRGKTIGDDDPMFTALSEAFEGRTSALERQRYANLRWRPELGSDAAVSDYADIRRAVQRLSIEEFLSQEGRPFNPQDREDLQRLTEIANEIATRQLGWPRLTRPKESNAGNTERD